MQRHGMMLEVHLSNCKQNRSHWRCSSGTDFTVFYLVSDFKPHWK